MWKSSKSQSKKPYQFTTLSFPFAWKCSDDIDGNIQKESTEGSEKLKQFLADGFVVSQMSTYVLYNVAYSHYFLEKHED